MPPDNNPDDTARTKLHPDPPPTAPPLEHRALAANGRAPTLMGGASVGALAAVRVWAPRREALWLIVADPIFLIAVWAAVRVALHPHHHFSLWFLVLLSGLLYGQIRNVVPAVLTLWRPGYVTTDESGIAVTTWRGSRAFRWEEIQSIERRKRYRYFPLYFDHPRLRLEVPEPVEINLRGYPSEESDRLFRLVVRSTALAPRPGKKDSYVRPESLPAGQVSGPSSP